jgi:hypothetical protein
MIRIRYFLLLAILLLIINNCSTITSTNDNPEWVNNLINEFENQSVGNPPQSIWQYDYLGQRVYYVPPQCCDQFSTLYDKNGNVLCAPDGGISGTGDGKCSDFFERRTNEKLIWKDTREK